MSIRKYSRVLLCAGMAVAVGMSGRKAAAAENGKVMLKTETMQVVQLPFFNIKELWRAIGAEHRYIDGLEEIGEQVLQKIEAVENSPGELALFSRTRGLEGSPVFANVTNYVNVRREATTSSEVVGKLYSGCVATVLEDSGNWVFVKSGNVSGYVIKEYLLFGDEAEEAIARKYTPKIQVTANELNVRSGAGTGYSVIETFTKGKEAELLEQGKEWMKILFSSGGKKKTGYVYAKYVKVTGEPQYGETLAEERERIATEKKAAAEAAAKAEADRLAAIENTKRNKAKQVAEYAKTAVGTAYVWGGTNMSTGVDCSGLCYAAYKKYGYTLPRTSRDMAASSALLSVTPNTNHLRAGDLVFYASGGRVDHVAMYIGGGKVVHASDYSTGVIISTYNYRTPHSAKRVIY
ncbi:MAG: NlpC/P60 family protein [Lachnospiraceae bacterium]|nr:NlpC/P60 family protein [Lachnospiraceae bacterium]